MKPCSHKTPSLSTPRSTPKNQVKAQVQHEYYCCNIQYVMVQKLDWKQRSYPQIASLSFIFARDGCPGTASRAQGFLHISFHPPIWILQIYRKNKQLGGFGRKTLPREELRLSTLRVIIMALFILDSAWDPHVQQELQREAPRASLALQPFPFPPLGSISPWNSSSHACCVQSAKSCLHFFSLVAYGIYKSYFISL